MQIMVEADLEAQERARAGGAVGAARGEPAGSGSS